MQNINQYSSWEIAKIYVMIDTLLGMFDDTYQGQFNVRNGRFGQSLLT